MQQFDLSSLLNQQNPKNLLAYLIAIVVSIVFAILLDFVYRYYFIRNYRGIEVNKSFTLIAPAVTTVFLVIQFSLPLSLGLLGALSFIRFRTPIKEPEEIGFLLIVIATSLACAVFRFEVGLLLVTLIAIISVFKNYSVFSKWLSRQKTCELFLTFSNAPSLNRESLVQQIYTQMTDMTIQAELLSISEAEEEVSYHFKLKNIHSKSENLHMLPNRLKQVESISCVNLICNE
jgi:hypothetical protein